MTKTSKILSIAALSLCAAAGAQAEAYQGVHSPLSTLARADVHAQATRAAAAPDQNVARGSRGAEVVAQSRDRAQVRAEAVRAAAAPDQNVAGGSRVNSRVISTLQNPADLRAAAPAAAAKL